MPVNIAKALVAPLVLFVLISCSFFEGRESAGQYADDTAITAKVKQAYVTDPEVQAMQVNVETMQGVVQLSGFVDSQSAKEKAERLARGVGGVKGVRDTIVVRSGAS